MPPETADTSSAEAAVVQPATWRDPQDVRTIFQLLSVLLIVLGLFVLSAAGNVLALLATA